MSCDTPCFRLAQLSDVHLGPLPALRARDWNIKRALGYANWQRKRKALHQPDALAAIVADLTAQQVDHVAVTGDLVNIGLPEEHEAAARWLASVGDGSRVSVIPGNHDIYTRLWRDVGVARWQTWFASCDYGNEVRELTDVDARYPFPSVRRLGPIALIGLNSALPTPPGIAAGRLGRRQRRPLGPILDATKAAGLCRVVMIHHPPLQESGTRLRGLRDGAALRALLARHGCELVMHGHNHRDQMGWIEPTATTGNRVPVIAAASASAAFAHHGEPLARYNIYDITGAPGRWQIAVTVRGLTAPNGRVGEIAKFPLPTSTPEIS